jgi:hypothetical protein
LTQKTTEKNNRRAQRERERDTKAHAERERERETNVHTASLKERERVCHFSAAAAALEYNKEKIHT